jgi:FkbM family methyltransferase
VFEAPKENKDMDPIRKYVASRPPKLKHALKLWRYARQMRGGQFVIDDSEFRRVQEFVKAGDTAIDVGANVGHYTWKLAHLVGPTGRVISFEPIPDTFTTLTGNVCGLRNVTLLNIAASDVHGHVAMDLPGDDPENFYRASISASGAYSVLTMPLDALDVKSCALLKVDAEGHDAQVLKGAARLIERCQPLIIVEAWDASPAAQWLRDAGYRLEREKGSPNLVARPQ